MRPLPATLARYLVLLKSVAAMSAFGSTGARAMQGSLFVYAPGRQAFVTGSLQKKAAVLLGGLSDGLLACPYAPPLAKALEALGYATVQPVLRSSYAQFGFGSLDNDVEDLEELLGCEAFGGVEEVFMVGHSTGSQICALSNLFSSTAE